MLNLKIDLEEYLSNDNIYKCLLHVFMMTHVE